MIAFEVHGPFDVAVTTLPKGRMVQKKDACEFWKNEGADLANRKGCYVLALRAGKGMKPVYVGMTAKSFLSEVFNDRNCQTLTTTAMSQKGTLILFLIASPTAKTSKATIDELEKFLIQAGLAANSSLANDRKTKPERWRIKGLIRAKTGESSNASRALQSCVKV